jgi:dihydrofolate synthase/folylpolyglutamate synthase
VIAPLPSPEQELLALFAKRGELIKPGLERIKTALKQLPCFAELAPIILVGGTNGKGSTSGMLWHLLAACDLRVGLFSSPHLCQFAERIQCSHREIDSRYLLEQLQCLQRQLPHELYERLSFFEVNTLLALQVFLKENCQFIVLEVGLGGRWDATNSVEPIASAITSIDKDHEQWLGNSLASIAREKLGICRAHKPLFWGERYSEEKKELQAILGSICSETGGIPMLRGEHFALEGSELTIALPGLAPQRVHLPVFFAQFPALLQQNFALSLSLFYWLLHQESYRHFFKLAVHDDPCERFRAVLKRVGSPGIAWPPSLIARMQHLRFPASPEAPEIICDVSHNPAGISEFLRYLNENVLLGGRRKNIPTFFSCLKDKDVGSMLDLLRPIGKPLILFQIGNERTFSYQDLPARHADLPFFADFSEAWHYASTRWQGLAPSWSICGSVAAIGEVLHYFSAYPLQRSFQKILMGTLSNRSAP